jgi:hypothetical protein
MQLSRVFLATVACAMVSSSVNAAATTPVECAALASLLRQARTDFPSLRRKKIEPGKCSYRDTEFKCEWAFPGDAFEVSNAEASKLVRCMAAQPGAQPAKGKRSESAFTVDPDLTVLVAAPDLDGDGWKVRLRILTSWKPQ